MIQYDNTNRGVLFKNDRKEQDNHPDYKGSINIDGQEFWLSAWIKEGQKGKFMSMSVKPKEDQPRRQEEPSRGRDLRQAQPRRPDPISTGRPRNDDMDDSIPFAPEFR